MYLTLLILGMALCAFVTKYLPVVLFKDSELPPVVKLALGYVPPAVLAALVFPAVVPPLWQGGADTFPVPTLVGGLVTLIAGRIPKVHFLVATAIGVVTFFLMRQLLGS